MASTQDPGQAPAPTPATDATTPAPEPTLQPRELAPGEMLAEGPVPAGATVSPILDPTTPTPSDLPPTQPAAQPTADELNAGLPDTAPKAAPPWIGSVSLFATGFSAAWGGLVVPAGDPSLFKAVVAIFDVPSGIQVGYDAFPIADSGTGRGNVDFAALATGVYFARLQVYAVTDNSFTTVATSSPFTYTAPVTVPPAPAPEPPTVGRIVYYMAQGSADGKYPSVERAAIVTQVHSYTDGEVEGFPSIGVCVLNPSGMHFNQDVRHSSDGEPGTWDWMPYQKARQAKG